jgi:aspartyl-tRNA synthetase
MPNYYEEQVKKYGRKKRIDRTEARVISTTETYQTCSSWNKGIPHAEATKEQIRLSCLKSGVGTWNKGIKKSEEWAEKISQSKIKYFQTHRTWNKGFPCSQATKEEISQTLIQKYKEGIHKPWNKGMKIKQQRQSQRVQEVVIDPPLTSYS